MAVPTDDNISVEDSNQIGKCKDLPIEIEKMWHLLTIPVPVIVRALGMIKKGTDKHIKRYLTVTAYMKSKKKVALCGIAHLFVT